MQVYRYPKHVLLLDGLRAGFGILVTFGPLLFLDVGRIMALVLATVGFLFLWFGGRVLSQWFFSVAPSSEGLQKGGASRFFLAWKDLKTLKLAHYAPVRRRQTGWYQLTLSTGDGRISVESTLEGFDDLLRLALEAATDAGLTFDPSTRDNLTAWAGRKPAR